MDLESEDSDIAEKSPSGRFIRYDEVVQTGTRKIIVHKAFDTMSGAEVDWNKVSVPSDSLESLEHIETMISSEFQLLKSLKHENIIKSYGAWFDPKNREINVLTESFSSGTLRRFRQKHKGIDINAVKNWGKQILHGLQYLHTHEPPVIHGNLNCDNIFVNGNTGEIKIGEIGFATVTQEQHPTLYQEKFDELVDVYAFGLCLLELVTCEIPFNEGKTQSQLHTKIALGEKPAALGKVKDPRIKQFIEQCLCPAPMRSGVAELLKDPIFLLNLSLLPPNGPCFTKCNGETGPHSSSGYRCCNKKSEFQLRGTRIDVQLISLRLDIVDFSSQMKKIEFEFDLFADTALSVAGEMVDDLDLSIEDVVLIAELMDRVITNIDPCWKPLFVNYSGSKSSYGDSVLAF